jgi:hypothetical protein
VTALCLIYPFITFWLECVAPTLKSHVKRRSGYAFLQKSDKGICKKFKVAFIKDMSNFTKYSARSPHTLPLNTEKYTYC